MDTLGGGGWIHWVVAGGYTTAGWWWQSHRFGGTSCCSHDAISDRAAPFPYQWTCPYSSRRGTYQPDSQTSMLALLLGLLVPSRGTCHWRLGPKPVLPKVWQGTRKADPTHRLMAEVLWDGLTLRTGMIPIPEWYPISTRTPDHPPTLLHPWMPFAAPTLALNRSPPPHPLRPMMPAGMPSCWRGCRRRPPSAPSGRP